MGPPSSQKPNIAGGFLSGLIAPDPMPDATDPTAECAKCNSTAVYLLDDGGLVCGKCGAKLTLEITEIAPGYVDL